MKNKALKILLAAIVAIGLWLYVITVVSPESEKTYYDIPVVMQNKDILTERGLMVVSEDPNVTLTLKSDRATLNDLNESNINVLINLANIEQPGTHSLSYNIAYPGNVNPTEVAVQSSSTDMITLKVENRVRKVIPVVLDYGESSVPEGYIADIENAQLNNTGIEVIGPGSIMENIEKAVISVDLTGQTKSVVGEYQYTLCDDQDNPVDTKNLVTTNVDVVSLLVKVEKVKEIALNVDIISGGGVTKDNCAITLDTTQIQISGSEAILEDLDSLTLGVINLGEITESQTLTFPIELPEGVTNQTGVEQVTVDIQLPDLKMRTFKVTSISAANVPTGLQVDIITKALQVTVRGPAKLVDQMKATDISVIVNLSEAQAGTVTMKGDVVFSAGFPGVGEMSTYLVTANLRD